MTAESAIEAGASAATQGMNTWNGSVHEIGLLGALVGGVLLLLVAVVLITLVFLFRQNRQQTEAYTKSTDRLYTMLDHQTVVGVEDRAMNRAAIAEISSSVKLASETMAESTKEICASLLTVCRHPPTARTRVGDAIQT